MLIDIYRKLRKIPLVDKMGETYLKLEDKTGTKAALKQLQFLHEQKTDLSRNIRVGFLVQDPNIWNKSRSIYAEMKQRDNIDITIICVPDPYQEDSASTYNWFCNEGYECLDARIGNGPWSVFKNQGEWLDLKALQLDYLFYGQPYDAYLPPSFRSKAVSKYIKLCVATYGVPLTMNLMVATRPRTFYRNMSFAFAQLEEEKAYGLSQFGEGQKDGFQRVENYGPCVFDDFVKAQDHPNHTWDFSQNEMRGMWTPRWTTDESIGGSNFFRYKDVLFKYAEDHPEMDLLYRPHPMALDNFLKIGKMTQEEVDAFRKKCKDMPNMDLDTNRDYGYTFWNCSVLVTDLSSIIAEYFITGKPFIFCKTENDQQEYLKFFQEILDSAYVVRNQDELLAALDMIREGQDPKKEERQALITKLFGVIDGRASERIVQTIVDDYMSRGAK